MILNSSHRTLDKEMYVDFTYNSGLWEVTLPKSRTRVREESRHAIEGEAFHLGMREQRPNYPRSTLSEVWSPEGIQS